MPAMMVSGGVHRNSMFAKMSRTRPMSVLNQNPFNPAKRRRPTTGIARSSDGRMNSPTCRAAAIRTHRPFL